MPHILFEMDECNDALAGDATTGGLVDLRAAYHALDTKLNEDVLSQQETAAIHALLENIQAFLCTGGTYEMGVAAQAAAYADACRELM